MRQVLRRSWVSFTLLLWAIGWFLAKFGHGSGDWTYFRAAVRSVYAAGVQPLPGGPLHLYAEMPELQFGPPIVLLMLPTMAVTPSTGRLLAAGGMVLVGLVSLWAIYSTAKSLGKRPSSLTVLVAGLLLIPTWVTLSVTWMHLDDVVALGCLSLALRLIVADQGLAAGLLLGIGGASKPWAVMFWPLIMLLPRASRPLAALVCVVVAAGSWAPFLLADPTTGPALGHTRAFVADDSTLRLLHLAGQWTPPWLRPVQFALGLVVTAAVIWRGRWIAAPLAAVTIRLVTDGSTYPYYGTAAVLAAAMWDLLAPRRFPLATAAAVLVEFLCPLVLPDTAMAVLRLGVGVALLGALLRPSAPGSATEAAPSGSVAVAA